MVPAHLKEGVRSELKPVHTPGPLSMITFVFRRRTPTAFSLEKQFDALYVHLEKSGVKLRRLELPHVTTGIVTAMQNIWFVARRRKTRILHIAGDVHYASLLCPFSRTIITVADCVVLQRGTGFKRFVMRALFFGLPIRFAAAVAVISEQTKKELMETVSVPERKVTVIPVSLDPAFEFSERPFAVHLPRILHVGTTSNKNLPKVIAALRDVSCVLVIVGPMSEVTLAQLIESGIRYENFVGIDHAAVTRLYRDADIISFPSSYEGFGMPIIEGQATGRPVLTSDLEPMRSVAGPDGALLINPQFVESIREGFLALIGDGALRARLVAAGRNNCSRFTLEAVAASYLDLYRRLDESDKQAYAT
jgi:glycosyltransferase involved in cell wall biosynthesis